MKLDKTGYRNLFPVTKRFAYLNHAGVAPISVPAARAMRRAVNECLHRGAARYSILQEGVRRARQSAALLLGVPPREIAFVKNTSEGISHVAQGFPWREGDRVVVPEGEFPANVYPWLNLKKRGVETVRVPMRRGRLSLDDFRDCLDLPRVRLLTVSAVEFETGFANDLAALGQMCAERSVFFFVDAIQALGWTRIEPGRLGVHALAADGHKWLLGPEGAGIFWLSPGAPAVVEPTEVGWHSVAEPLAFSRISFELRQDAGRFEPGSQAVVLLHGLGEALDLLREAGMDRVREISLGLANRAREEIGRRGFRLLSSDLPSEQSPIVSFVPLREPGELQAALARRGVITAARGEGLRLSPHFYNDEGDLERFFDALDEAQGGGREKKR